jgi:polysaccharide biosynthesis/export protein
MISKYIFKYTTPILFLIILFNSCKTAKDILYIQDLNSTDISKVFSSQNTLQENDILKIDVSSLEIKASVPYNKPMVNAQMGNGIDILQLNGYLVSRNKTINFPVLGEISVAGKTSDDLELYLKERLENEGHLIKSNITVRLINSKFTILGEVNIPGTYTFTEKNISLLQALGYAGDLTIDGNRKDIIVIRNLNGQRITSKLDLTSSSWLTSPYQNIHPNDIIIVNPNSKKIRSAGLIGNLTNVLSIASVLLSTIILIR